MINFEWWYNQFNNSLTSKTEKKLQERAWKAALEWVLREGIDEDWVEDTIKEELNAKT